jgi:hypothetical protein
MRRPYEPTEFGQVSKPQSPWKSKSWYVLYHDSIAHYVRRASDLEGALLTAACLLDEGGIVDQVGPLDDKDRREVIDRFQIRRGCAALLKLARGPKGKG